MTFTKQFSTFLCLVSLLLAVGCGQEANSVSADPRALEIRLNAKLKQLTTGLNLTAEQQAQVKTLLIQEDQDRDKINTEAARTGEDKVLKLIALRTNTYERIKPLLTPEQSQQFADVIKKLESRKRR